MGQSRVEGEGLLDQGTPSGKRLFRELIRPPRHRGEGVGELSVGGCELRVEIDRLLEQLLAAREALGSHLVPLEEAHEIGVVRLEVFGVALDDRRPLSTQELHLEVFDDGEGDLVLDLEDVLETPVETLRPQVRAVPHIDELGSDAQPVAGLAHAPLDDGPDVQSTADLTHVLILALEGEGRGPRHHAQALHLGQGVDDLLGNTVAEELLLGIGRQIGERQHRHRRPVVAPLSNSPRPLRHQERAHL